MMQHDFILRLEDPRCCCPRGGLVQLRHTHLRGRSAMLVESRLAHTLHVKENSGRSPSPRPRHLPHRYAVVGQHRPGGYKLPERMTDVRLDEIRAAVARCTVTEDGATLEARQQQNSQRKRVFKKLDEYSQELEQQQQKLAKNGGGSGEDAARIEVTFPQPSAETVGKNSSSSSSAGLSSKAPGLSCHAHLKLSYLRIRRSPNNPHGMRGDSLFPSENTRMPPCRPPAKAHLPAGSYRCAVRFGTGSSRVLRGSDFVPWLGLLAARLASKCVHSCCLSSSSWYSTVLRDRKKWGLTVGPGLRVCVRCKIFV